jgi:hypothetical protein
MARSAVIAVIVAATALSAPAPVAACLWDVDTLREESLGDRDVAAVVAGDLGKHSLGFYQAKVTYTRALIARGDAKAERYDDLAVALAKTGALDEALVVLADKDRRFPGLYTTHANRGTLLASTTSASSSAPVLASATARSS